MIDMIFTDLNTSIAVFRAVRILRVARVLRFLSYINIIHKIISKQFSSFIYICILLILLIIVYSLIGSQIYVGKLTNSGFRQSFDSFYFSFLSVFQLITMENWNDIENMLFNSSVAILPNFLYLLSLIFLGNYVFLNLFLGVLLHGFTSVKVDEDIENYLYEIPQNNEIIVRDNNNDKKGRFAFWMCETENLDKRKFSKKKVNFLYEGIDCKESLWVFQKDSTFRKIVYHVVHSNKFENIILFVIFLSSIKLALDTYVDSDQQFIEFVILSDNVDIIFNSFFMLEALIKIISFGMFMDKGSYLRDYWNQLDFFIVFISLVDMCMTSIDLQYIKVMNLLIIFYKFKK